MESIIHNAIAEALGSLGISDARFVVEHPIELAHGDFATNAALAGAKHAGKDPRTFAGELVAALEGKLPQVARIEIAGPGFINFHLTREYFAEAIARIPKEGDAWGTNESWKGKVVAVEYTDPNPFKEFHVGHIFTNSVGESISRLFAMAGASVKRMNYQGDIGMHVAHAVWGMREMGIAPDSEFSARELGKAYARGALAYKENEEAAREMKRINKALYERSDSELNALYDKGREVSLAYFETIYEMLGTKFDHYFFESTAAPKGKELVFAHPDVFTQSEGAYVFLGEQYGLHTRVFLNSEGLPTYEAKELALAKMKYDAVPYDHSVVATSGEITEYFKVLKKAMEFVYPELAAKTEHIGHGTVRLAEGKMSSRTGNIIAGIDFIAEIAAAAREKMAETGASDPDEGLARDIAIAAIKYATLRSNVFQDSVFNREQALSFEGDSGPYLQYTYARICSVLEKAATEDIAPNIEHMPELPYEIERLVYRFPGVVAHALSERSPHHVTVFLTELAGAFNTFYARERIADQSDEFAPYKAAVAVAVQQTLKNGLWVLGIKAPERM